MVQAKTKSLHAPSCRFRHAPEKAPKEKALYLYREFKSEAVRLLLPFLDEPGYTSKLNSFVAALELGLRKYFGGKIDHLQSTIHSEPLEDSHRRKQFLVLYDCVPGGTGYLKELIRDQEKVFDILERAASAMRTCGCEDGCYGCIYAYRHARDMADTSKRIAIEEIGKILKEKGSWQKIKTLGNVSVSGLLESLLEAKFVEALARRIERDARDDEGEVRVFGRYHAQGKNGYRLDFGGHSWRIEPQVLLDDGNDVVEATRADFVIRPEREGSVRPIAIYVDGFRFHSNNLASDFEKRMAVLASGHFWVWSLSWDDVEAAHVDGIPHVLNPLENSKTALGVKVGFDKLSAQSPMKWSPDWSSFECLYQLLKTQDQDALGTAAFIRSFSSAPERMVEMDGWFERLEDRVPSVLAMKVRERVAPEWVYAITEVPDAVTGGPLMAPELAVFLALPKIKDGAKSAAVIWLDDTPLRLDEPNFKKQWHASLTLLNTLQFFETVAILASERAHEMNFHFPRLSVLPAAGGLAQPVMTPEWKEVFKWASSDWEDTIRGLFELRIPSPTGGYALMSGIRVVAEAELAWERSKVALLLPEEDDARAFDVTKKAFEAQGWEVRDIAVVGVEELQNLIRTRESET